MSTSYTGNPILGQQQQQEQRRRELLEMQALIREELAAYPPGPAVSFQPTSFTDQPSIYKRPRHEFSRSLSMTGATSRNAFPGRIRKGPSEMSRSTSQQSVTASMSRTKSMGAPPSSISRPLANVGRVAPRPQPTEGHLNPSVIEAWTSQHDDPYTCQPYRQSSLMQSGLEQVPELDFGEDPRAYFSRRKVPLLSVSTVDIPTDNFLIHPAVHPRLPSSRRSTFSNAIPNTPSSATLTTGTTLASEMSRQSSTCNDAMQSFQMMNVHSNTSMFSDLSSTDDAFYDGSNQFYSSVGSKQVSSSEEQTILVAGAGGESYGQQASFSLFSSQKVPSTLFDSSIPHVEDMQRTESNESNVSTSSTKSRSRQQLQKQNQLATNRKLAPKAGSDDDSSHKASPLLRIKSNDGSDDKIVASIPKTPYQRPKHDRLFCQYCDDREGFRGAHELGRHHDRQHKDMVKKWVCIEPVDGAKKEFRPINQLAKCKACSQQKKKYGAYYNAAAHLRRAHFVPKPRGRGKSSKAEDKSEKRGGKGGGDWPPMHELKRWMKEVYEKADTTQQGEDEESADEEIHGDFEEVSSNRIASNAIPFDQSHLYPNDAQMFEYSSSAASSYGGQTFNMDMNMHMGMMNVPYELSLQQQDFDSSMLFAPNQQSANSFDSSVLMNDNMSFIDAHQAHSFATTPSFIPGHQNFTDSELGSDLFFSYDAAM